MAYASWAKARTRKISLSLHLANENIAQVTIYCFIEKENKNTGCDLPTWLTQYLKKKKWLTLGY